MATPGVGACACCGAALAATPYAPPRHCPECALRSARRLGRGFLWLALAFLFAGAALVGYLLFCLDAGARPLFAVTLPAAVVAAGGLAHLLLPRRPSERPHACEGPLARALAAVPGPAPALALAAFAIATGAGFAAFPPSNEKTAWRRVTDSADAGPVYDYAREWPGRRPEAELAGLAWERTRSSADPASLARFLEAFPGSPHAPEARQALDRARVEARRHADAAQLAEELRRRKEAEAQLIRDIAEEEKRVLASGSAGACLDFLKRCPWSGRAAEVRGALLALVEKRAEEERPKWAAALFAAGTSGSVGVGFTEDTPGSWRPALLAAIDDALAEFGLKAVEVPLDRATIRLGVSQGTPQGPGDVSGEQVLARGSGCPLQASGSLAVYRPGAAEAVWKTSMLARCDGVWIIHEKDADAEVESRVRHEVCEQLRVALRIRS
ncbi:MAG: hypothetical protein HYY18_07365 [Planctomycetes bacterium]|nr:hypothetical protein [Planctomycetota bacterium]